MANERDYQLALGIKLVDDDIKVIRDQISKAFANIKPIQIKVTGNATATTAGITKLSESIQQVSTRTQLQNRLMEQFWQSNKKAADSAEVFVAALNKQERAERSAADAAQKQLQFEQQLLTASNASARAAMDQAAAEERLSSVMSRADRMLQSKIARQNELVAAMERTRAAESATTIGGMRDRFNANTQPTPERQAAAQRSIDLGAIGAGFEENLRRINPLADSAARTWERYGGQVRQAITAQRSLSAAFPATISGLSGIGDQLVRHITTFAEWSAAAKLVETGVRSIEKAFADAIHAQKEQTIVGMYYSAAGGQYSPQMSNTAMNAAIAMARLYGQEVIHVQENIGLWAKVTNGQLLPAIALTNNAMKLAAVSGMNMEEIYRDTVAVMGQLQEPMSRVNDLYNVATGLALRYGGGIQTLGGQSDDAVKQMMDGMTRLTAIMSEGLGKGRDTLAKIGAQVAIVSHLTNQSGDEVATHLSAAFAKIESGKVEQALGGIGIKVRDNTNLIEEMGAKWGQVMPILQAGGVRSQDLESVATLVQNAKKYAEAVAVAKKAMADNASAQAFDKLQKTLSIQLNELKAGWESVGISIAQQFLPAMTSAVNYGNNNVIPFLIAHKTEISDLTHQLIGLGAGYLVMSSGATIIGVLSRTWNEFSLAWQSATNTMTASDRAAMMSLNSLQSMMAKTTVVQGEYDVAMEAAIKQLAATYNLSIEQVILSLHELQVQAGVVSESVIADDLAMGGAIDALAERTGIAASTIKTEFTEVAETATISAAAIGKAFLAAIPIVGQVILAASLGFDAYKAVKGFADDKYNERMRTDPTARAQAMAVEEQKQASLKSRIAHLQNGSDSVLYSPYSRMGTRNTPGERASQLSGLQDQLRKSQEFEHKLMHPELFASQQDQLADTAAGQLSAIKAKMDEISRNAQAGALSHIYGTIPEPEQALVDPTKAAKAKKGKGPPHQDHASAAQDITEAMDEIAAKFDEITSKIQASLNTNDKTLSHDRRQFSIYGYNSRTLAPYGADVSSRLGLDRSMASSLGNEASAYQGELTKAQHSLTPYAPTSREFVAGEQKIAGIKQKIAAIRERMSRFQDDITAQTDALNDATVNADDERYQRAIKGVKTDFSAAQSTLNGSKTFASATTNRNAFDKAQQSDLNALLDMRAEIMKRIASEGGNATQAEQRWLDAIKDEIDTIDAAKPGLENYLQLHQKIQNDMQAAALQTLKVYDKPTQDAIKSTLSLRQQYDSNAKTYAVSGNADQIAELNTWRDQQQAIINATYALSEYNEKVKQLESTQAFKLVKGGLDTLGSLVTKTIYDNLNPRPDIKDQEAHYNGAISQLQLMSSLERGPAFMGARFSNMVQEQNLRQQEQAARDRASAPPSFIRQFGMDMEKQVLGGSMSNLLSNIGKSLIQAKLGPSPQEQTQQQAIAAQQQLNEAIQNGFVPASSTIMQAAQLQLQAAQTMIGAVQGGTGTGGDVFAQFGVSSSVNQANAGWDKFTAANPLSLPGGGGTALDAAAATNSGSIFGGGIAGTALSKAFSNFGKTTIGKSLGSAISGFGTGGAIASLFGGNSGNGAMGGGIGGILSSLLGANPFLSAVAPIAGGLLGGLFGNHFSQASEPDIYAEPEYGTFMSNLMGQNWGANGSTYYFDPAISQQTGGLGMGAFISKFLGGKNSQQLNSIFGTESSAISQMFSQWGSGPTSIGNGNVSIGPNTYAWQNVEQLANDAFQQIVQASNTLNQALAPIVSVSAYGAGSASFSPYYTPGYGDVSSLYNLPYPYLYATNTTSAAYPSVSQNNLNQPIQTTVNIDGKTVAQVVSNYRSQKIAQGFLPDS